jgi:hypothetical protein
VLVIEDDAASRQGIAGELPSNKKVNGILVG